MGQRFTQFWDAFMYGLRGGLVLDVIHDLKVYWRFRTGVRWLSQMAADRAAELHTPWGMLDREDADHFGHEYCRRLGIELASVQSIRPIIKPVDYYARPWSPET